MPVGNVANKRLKNKVMWALEDMDQIAIGALIRLEKAADRAELKCADPALMLLLTRIRADLAEIRTLAMAARSGEYAGKRFAVFVTDDEED